MTWRRQLSVLACVVLLAGCGQVGPVREIRIPFYGLDEPYASLPRAQRLSAQLGRRPNVFSLFIRLDTTSTARTMSAIAASGMTPFVTLEPWHLDDVVDQPDPSVSLSRIAAGDLDGELLTQARALAAYGLPFYLRFAHEMNASWYPWGVGVNGNTPAEYVAAWRHVHALFASVDGLRVRWVWSPVAVQNPGADRDLAAFYPGDDEVDYLGLTGYEHHGGDPSRTFDPTLRRLLGLSARPVVLSEIGVDGPGKRRWLAGLGRYLLDRPVIAGFVYFDTSPRTTGATGDYALTNAADRAAFAHSLSQLRPVLSERRSS